MLSRNLCAVFYRRKLRPGRGVLYERILAEDSFNGLPFNPGGTKVGSVDLDGGTYDIISRDASGASIDGSSSWVQFYSIRAISTPARMNGPLPFGSLRTTGSLM